MANPPIVIGSFDNVPAPGSPIKSDWPQEISTFVQRLPRGLIGSALRTADQGPIASGATTDLTGLTVTFTPFDANRRIVTEWKVRMSKDATGGAVWVDLTDAAGTGVDQVFFTMTGSSDATFTGFCLEPNLAVASTTRKLRVTTNAGTVTLKAGPTVRAQLMVWDLGSTLALPS